MNSKLIILVPCYNEEEIIDYSVQKLDSLLNSLITDNLVNKNSKICFVNDGSKDKTKDIIEKYCQKNNRIMLINLAGNFGQQNAILAGLNNLEADMVVTIDADLQDDYLTIREMVEKYYLGYDIVYGIRKERKTDSFFKRTSAKLFYKFMNLIGIKIRKNHSEYRLMSKSAIEKLKDYKEKTIFLRGIVQNIALPSAEVYYDRQKRIFGETKYSVFKLFSLAWSAITSFSILPLRLITLTGAIMSFASLTILLYALFSYFKHIAQPGWTSIIITIAFFFGITIMSIGIIGEYLGKILIEVKNRPLYQIKEIINDK